MYVKSLALAATAALGLAVAAAPASATTYDFDPLSGQSFTNGGSPSTLSLNGATFSTSSPGVTFGFLASNGSYLTLGNTVLSETSSVGDPLTISFAQAQNGISFNYAVEDGFALNGNDTLTLTTNTGFSESVNPTLSSNPNALYPEGLFTLAGGQPFTSITLTATDGGGAETLAIGNLASTPVPLPGALWLLGSGLLGLGGVGVARRGAAKV